MTLKHHSNSIENSLQFTLQFCKEIIHPISFFLWYKHILNNFHHNLVYV